MLLRRSLVCREGGGPLVAYRAHISGNPTHRPLRGAAVPTVRKISGTHVKYHHGKGETMRAKKVQVEIGKPKVMRIDVAATHESGSAMAI
jgi:hypothetical protein